MVFHYDYYTVGFLPQCLLCAGTIHAHSVMKRKATYKSTQAKSFESMHAICFTSSLHKKPVDVLANCESNKAICVVEFR